MKKSKALPVLFIFGLLTLLILSIFGLSACDESEDDYTPTIDPLYKFSLSSYGITYDVKNNCEISVTEDIEVKYMGYYSTGFIRDIPVNGGAKVADVKVEKLEGDSPSFWYDVYFENNSFVSVDIGDSSNKYRKSERYLLTYKYIITNKVVNKSMLPLNVIGHGWACDINDVTVQVTLPEGYESAKAYIGKKGSTTPFTTFTEKTSGGKTVIEASIEEIAPYTGLTFDFTFEKGAIKNFKSSTPVWFIIAGAVLAGIIFAVKFLFFNKVNLMPVVNYEAPNKMTPLLMGKLIDNKVDKEDITSMIFYFASKGYLKINLDNQKDPTLIRILNKLPDSCTKYERTLFYGLFESGEVVACSQLKNKFYKSVSAATAQVNNDRLAKNMYNKTSIVLSIVFAVLAGLVAGIAPLLLGFLEISHKLTYFMGLIIIVPVIMINLFGQSLVSRKYKLKKQTFILLWCLIGLACVIVSLFYLLVPSAIIGNVYKFFIAFICCGGAAASSILVTKTESYNSLLGDITGFKQFIMLAEKNQLETMIEEDPQLYYEILPYAQVLGVTDVWEKKFEDITIEPPSWAMGDMVTNIVEFHIINSIIRSSMSGMTRNFVSSPSSSGSNGFGGGFGGGFSGGGFGGGGGRGR